MYVAAQRIDPARASAAAAMIAEGGERMAWLDSGIGDAERGRRSLVTLELEERVRFLPADVGFGADPSLFAWLDARFAEDASASLRVTSGAPPLGWVGYCSFEAGALADAGLPAARGEGALIEAYAVRAALVVEAAEAWVVADGASPEEAEARAAQWARRSEAARSPSAAAPEPLRAVEEPELRAWHRGAVNEVLEAIRSGRAYQACLTFPLRFEPVASLWPYYAALRARSPGDFGAYLRFADVEAASTSPERLLHIEGRRVWSRPMKGTRPRGRTPDEDAALAAALRASAKDRAENVMIVDLVRNDLGRVAEVGSVRVPSLYEVERYATVWQMTSTVEARLRPEVGPFGALAASFPPGSMTGAPKIAACELLRRLEHAPRGLYSGTVFWMGYDDRHACSVVIRTLQWRDGSLRWDVGGGIVADSTPDDEWLEAMAKSAALDAIRPRELGRK